jgi:hypothetical protein
MKDLTISLTDQPGSLAALGEATGRAGINMEGACAYVEDGKAVAHICVDDADAARRALREAAVAAFRRKSQPRGLWRQTARRVPHKYLRALERGLGDLR